VVSTCLGGQVSRRSRRTRAGGNRGHDENLATPPLLGRRTARAARCGGRVPASLPAVPSAMAQPSSRSPHRCATGGCAAAPRLGRHGRAAGRPQARRSPPPPQPGRSMARSVGEDHTGEPSNEVWSGHASRPSLRCLALRPISPGGRAGVAWPPLDVAPSDVAGGREVLWEWPSTVHACVAMSRAVLRKGLTR
jgi:hypothetical protein